MEESEKLKLESFIEGVGSHKGRHTELVTVYIPAGYSLSNVVRQIEQEKSTASNIKSKNTRKAVLDSLEKIERQLKLIGRTPENGMAIFAGNISPTEGVEQIEMWTIEPPVPLKTRLYRCDQDFVLEPLKEMLEIGDLYGLLVIDRKDAAIGLLEGKQIKVLKKLTSGVPSKVRAGGQCLSPDTLIMKDNGEIIEVKESHNPCIVISENFNQEKSEETPIIAKWENKKQLFKLITCYPKIEIKASDEHTFFVRTEKGIEEKQLSEIKEGDFLIMPEEIKLSLVDQKIEFIPIIKQNFNMKLPKIPKVINPDFAKILGYYLGDGSHEVDRITFFEQREEVAKYYKCLIEDTFCIEAKHLFRKDKNYHQLRVYSRVLSQLFKHIFAKKDKTLSEEVPPIILKSSDNSLASFIAGFFDAEGYVSDPRIALGINNSKIAKQLQFALLRIGIIASINEYDNNKNPYTNKVRYTLAIDDIESLKKFMENIGFVSKEKQDKLSQIIENRSNRNKVRQIAVNGKEVARILRNSGLSTHQFNCPDFFTNKKQISKEVFKERILDRIDNLELKRRLAMFYLSNLIVVKIAKIELIGPAKTIDIETKNHNFIANGLIVHNSSQRFHRVTEGLAKEFFRRVAEDMKEIFFNMPKLKGILVGGPMPTKDEFLEQGNLVTALKEKVAAVKDIGYADEHGLKLLVEASSEDLAEQEIIKEKKLLEKFFNTLAKNPSRTAYGLAEVKNALKQGAVDTLILSKQLAKEHIIEMTKMAVDIGAKVEIASVETQEGEQFYNITKGFGAILRFVL